MPSLPARLQLLGFSYPYFRLPLPGLAETLALTPTPCSPGFAPWPRLSKLSCPLRLDPARFESSRCDSGRRDRVLGCRRPLSVQSTAVPTWRALFLRFRFAVAEWARPAQETADTT